MTDCLRVLLFACVCLFVCLYVRLFCFLGRLFACLLLCAFVCVCLIVVCLRLSMQLFVVGCLFLLVGAIVRAWFSSRPCLFARLLVWLADFVLV